MTRWRSQKFTVRNACPASNALPDIEKYGLIAFPPSVYGYFLYSVDRRRYDFFQLDGTAQCRLSFGPQTPLCATLFSFSHGCAATRRSVFRPWKFCHHTRSAIAAERQVGGKASKAEFEKTRTGGVHEVEVVRGAKVFDVRVGPAAGSVIASAEDHADRRAEHGQDDADR